MLRQFFKGSLAFTAICLVLAAWLGWSQTASMAGMLQVLWIVIVLSVLEISLSFDNAVVNASVLKDMDPVWKRRFLTWGMVIAVFGMRILFPLAVVGITAHLGPLEAVRLSLRDPETYERLVSSAHLAISGYGGAFLAMIGIQFFFDSDKEVHWIGTIERRLVHFGNVDAFGLGLLLLVLYLISRWLPVEQAYTFLTAGIMGIATYIAVEAIGHWLERHDSKAAAGAVGGAVKAGLGGFIYLNVLDASFSFDGVIGAFALSNNMLIIALGLSIGAMWVRSLTIMLVEKGTLAEYLYLEHGAFWAILALAAIMLISPGYAVSETVTGVIGAVLIAAALGWSIRQRRRDAREAAPEGNSA